MAAHPDTEPMILTVDGQPAQAGMLAPDAAALLAIEQEMVSARDVASLTRHWAEDLLWFDFGPPLIEGLAAARERLQRQFAAAGAIEARIRRLDITVGADLGFAVSIQALRSFAPGGAPLLDAVFRQTDCFRNDGGRWSLLHQHISLPVSLRSGHAVLQWD